MSVQPNDDHELDETPISQDPNFLAPSKKSLEKLARRDQYLKKKHHPKYTDDPNRPYLGNKWDRQPYETAASYSVFCYYRDLDPMDRTLRKADEWYREKRGLRPLAPPNVTGSVTNWSANHRWKERVDAYDAYIAERDRLINERKRREAAEKHAEQAAKAQVVIMRPVEELARRAEINEDEIDEMSVKELRAVVRSFLPLLSDMQKSEVTALGGKDAVQAGPQQNDERVKMIAKQVRKMFQNPEARGMMEELSIEVSGSLAEQADED